VHRDLCDDVGAHHALRFDFKLRVHGVLR
jgi:hypothetical protein